MIEIRVLRRIFGPMRNEVTGEWKRQHNEELYDLYSSPNIVGVNKSRTVRSVGHMALMGDRRNAYVVLWGYLMERDYSKDLGVYGRLMLSESSSSGMKRHGLD
jgi:hypothetical protein